jgi:hypothetical protein
MKEILMKYINRCIKNNNFNREELLKLIDTSIFEEEKEDVLSLISKYQGDLTVLNKKLFNYFDDKRLENKYEKSQKKFNRNSEEQVQLEIGYKQYEDYVYSIVQTENYKARPSKKMNQKVKLLRIHNLFGHDPDQTLKDVFQEGRLYIWEGLKKYGVLPQKAKNFEGRMDQGYERNISGKSTFVFKNLFNSLSNLSFKSSSDKFTYIPVEFEPEVLGERDED